MEPLTAGDRLVLGDAVIALGVGFSTRCDVEELAGLAAGVLRQALGEGRTPSAGVIATLERKRDGGLLEPVAVRLGLKPLYLSPEGLAPFQEGMELSGSAAAAAGVGSVAEASALAAAGPGARLVVAKTTSSLASCAAARILDPEDPNRIKEPESP
ncbi:cobalamin biosynthesis protein [Thiohalorhabdus sp.]|uniref:cobalamin biosynthesis protein n=1 Tax=Thiohalorhabdus sp. TaxID=3094134 RepID=UPI002FC354C7